MNKGTALITGASAGIGAALAREFARRGFDLVITARHQQGLAALAAEFRDVRVDVITVDLSEESGVETLTAAIAKLGVEIDILVNNVGIAHTGRFAAMTTTEINQLTMLNMTSMTRLTHHFLPTMMRRGYGRILNVASVAAFQPIPVMSLYAASKAFVLSLSEGLSEELHGTGVSVTALCPGITRTPIEGTPGGPAYLTSSPIEVAREGVAALLAREFVCIPGVANQVAVTVARHQPRWLVRGLRGLWARFGASH